VHLRYCKIALTASNGLFLLLVVFNNLTDYGSNLLYIQNVLNMSTTFEGNAGMWRAIENPFIHWLFYATIILWEVVSLGAITYGSVKLWKARKESPKVFAEAKQWAVVGLTLSMLQWYVAFISIGGEWFLMWQSETWNGQDAAMRMFLMMAVCLLFLNQNESS